MKELLEEFGNCFEDDNDSEDDNDIFDLVLEYETIYEKLNEFIVFNRKEIIDLKEIINAISKTAIADSSSTILNKKKENINQIIDCSNHVVGRIRELENTIYKNIIEWMNELDNMETERYKTNQVKIQQSIEVELNEICIDNIMLIKPKEYFSKHQFKEWSNKTTWNLIFDSAVDGDGSNDVPYNGVFNKYNLYFIIFDTINNVFGGYFYMPGEFDKLDAYARWFYGREKNSFVFSLIRDGALKFKQYETHLFFIEEEGGFGLSRNNQDGYLYKFGWDIHLKRIGDNTYHCHVFLWIQWWRKSTYWHCPLQQLRSQTKHCYWN